MSDDETDSVAAARAEVQRTREELGETVEALAYKADVKTRAHDKAETLKARAEGTAQQLKAKAEETAEQLKTKAEATAQQAKSKAEGSAHQLKAEVPGRAELIVARVRQLPSAAYLGVAAGAVIVGLLLRGRSR